MSVTFLCNHGRPFGTWCAYFVAVHYHEMGMPAPRGVLPRFKYLRMRRRWWWLPGEDRSRDHTRWKPHLRYMNKRHFLIEDMPVEGVEYFEGVRMSELEWGPM